MLKGHFLFLTSIFGALFHNIGQMIVAIAITRTPAPLSYLPFFILSATITGLFTGLCAHYAQKHLGKLFRSQFL
jgi:heptaprenyl diphosphate synthase